ncbi:MAG TPA: hypothetical protein VKF32_03340 [Thermoanaerobaculia bacterium]|nr:hypothetical protein [Thermoanaerobaculia bacterium]
MSRTRAWAAATFLLAATARAADLPCAHPPSPATPPAFRLFLELGDGAVFGADRGAVPFAAALRVHPSLVLADGRFGFGLTGVLAYRNPGAEALGGGRASARLLGIPGPGGSRLFELSAALEALAGSKGSRQIGGALTLDIVDFAGLTLRALRDVHRTDTVVEVAVRLELTRIFVKRRTSAFETPPLPPETPRPRFYEAVEASAKAAAQDSLRGHDDVRDAMGGFVKTWLAGGVPRLSLDRLKPELAASGLDAFGGQADQAISDAEAAARRRGEPVPAGDGARRVEALLTGWCRAVATAGGR